MLSNVGSTIFRIYRCSFCTSSNCRSTLCKQQAAIALPPLKALLIASSQLMIGFECGALHRRRVAAV